MLVSQTGSGSSRSEPSMICLVTNARRTYEHTPRQTGVKRLLVVNDVHKARPQSKVHVQIGKVVGNAAAKALREKQGGLRCVREGCNWSKHASDEELMVLASTPDRHQSAPSTRSNPNLTLASARKKTLQPHLGARVDEALGVVLGPLAGGVVDGLFEDHGSLGRQLHGHRDAVDDRVRAGVPETHCCFHEYDVHALGSRGWWWCFV